ncbi:SgcJ/EcaC family oxidoreductase [Plantactinospora siamensis]|uniref:SgcJ/EcaC family oxidoreductase n=1 Tax=Plantactinospora siamensis TaxID=555372 RepID=A0ABV6NYU7_9ACTN
MISVDAAQAAVRATLSRIAEAWTAGDPDRYAALFTEDADYTAFDGTRMAGRRAIADGHRALFAGIMRGSRMTMRPPDIRFVADDVAVACTVGGIIMSWQRGRTAPSAKRLSAVTFVLVRHEGDWSVTAFQNTRYRPWSRTIMGRLMSRTAAGGTR